MVALKAARPDLQVVPLRGNVDTRLRKVDAGECDAIVLARAGLVRLGLEGRATQVLETDVSLPAVGQGALGIECRADDGETRAALAGLHDGPRRPSAWRPSAGCSSPSRATARPPWGPMRSASGTRFACAPSWPAPTAATCARAERTSPWPGTEADAHALGLSLGRELAGRARRPPRAK